MPAKKNALSLFSRFGRMLKLPHFSARAKLSPVYQALFAVCCLCGGITAAAAALPAAAELRNIEAVQSFSGAYLAGSYAADNDSPLAAAYFRRALRFAPQDKIVRRELLLSLIDDGDFPAAIIVAESMRGDRDPAILPIAQLISAADALKKRQYSRVRALVGDADNDKGEQDESLLWVFFTCWADYGSGQKARALRDLGQARFSEWYDFLSAYNAALILDLSNSRQTEAAYQRALHYRQMADIAPEAYEHLIFAYIGFTFRHEGKKAALRALDKALPSKNAETPLLQALRQAIDEGVGVPRLVSSPLDGAGEMAYAIGSTFLRAGEELYADVYLQTALFLRPKDSSALFRLGILAAKAKNTRKADKYFAQIPASSPYYADAEMMRALAINQDLGDGNAQDKKNAGEAAVKLEKIIRGSADKAPLQNVLANIYLQSGDYSAAISLLDKMLAQIKTPEKQDWSIYFQRGIAYERAKLWPKAEADFKQALQLSPKNADVLNYYGYSLVDRNINLNGGLEMARQAAQLEPHNGAVIDSVGWAYYKLGRYDEAVSTLERAVRLEPSESSINSHLGDAYWRTGRRLEAVFQWNHALAFKPETEEDKARIIGKLKYGLREDKNAADADKQAKP